MYAHLALGERQIRLLELLPASLAGDDVPHCTLSVVHLDDINTPTYEALSYTWKGTDGEEDGDIKHQYMILNNACLFIRPNLLDALMALRQTDSRMLWIDALCINQDDKEERARQVLLMAHIYRQAVGVIVWLGDTTGELFEDGTRQDYASLFRSCLDEIMAIKSCLILPETTANDPSPQDGDDRLCCLSVEHIDVLFYWMHCPYWRRVWVVQELVSAKVLTVQLGQLSLPWELMILAARKVDSHLSKSCCRAILWQRTDADREAFTALQLFTRAVFDIEDTRTVCETGCTLETQLRLHSARLASRPHDVVYALLGLVTDWGDGRPLEPNYGLDARIAICDAIRHIIDVHASLSILCGDYNQEGIIDETNQYTTTLEQSNLPSWALCFAASSEDIFTHGNFFSSPRLAYLNLYKASLNNKPSVRLTNRRDILRVEGVVLDHIAICANTRLIAGAVGDVYTKAGHSLALENNAKQVQTWFNLSRKFFAGFDYRANDESWRQALIRTVNCDVIHQNEEYIRTRSRRSPSPPPRTPTSFSIKMADKRLSEVETATAEIPERSNGGVHRDQGSAALRSVARSPSTQKSSNGWEFYGPFALNRDFFITERGYLGLGPASMVQGDVIAVLFGGTVPFVLRPSGPEHPYRYQLLGDCYCHGFMDGEALEDKTMKATWFELV